MAVDARSDLYSLGVTFYEMLAGRLPFPHTETGSEYEVFRGHIELAPPPLATVQPRVPPALAALVMRALAKDPRDRFPSGAEFLGALLDYERHAAQPARQLTHSMTEPLGSAAQQAAQAIPAPAYVAASPTPPAPAAVSTKPSARFSGLLIIGMLIALLVVAGVAALFWRRGSAPSTAATALSPPASTIAPTLPVAEDPQLQQARAHEEQELYDEAIKFYEAHLQTRPSTPVTATLRDHIATLKTVHGLLTLARVRMNQHDYVEAKKDYQEALRLHPTSQRAKAGLAEVEARLKRSR